MKSTVTVDGESSFFYYMPDIPAYHNRTDVKSNHSSINYILSSGARYEAFTSFETEVTLPAQLGGGIAFQVNDKLLVAGDLEYTFWSDFDGYVFDYKFDDSGITLCTLLNVWMVEDMVVPVDWKNTLKGSLGLQYQLSDVIRLRGGYAADQSPFDQGKLHFENIILDLATGYTTHTETTESGNYDIAANGGPDDITDNMAGTYSGSAFETIVQFSVRF
jgi:long-subunit fatty acid transport protein